MSGIGEFGAGWKQVTKLHSELVPEVKWHAEADLPGVSKGLNKHLSECLSIEIIILIVLTL